MLCVDACGTKDVFGTVFLTGTNFETIVSTVMPSKGDNSRLNRKQLIVFNLFCSSVDVTLRLQN